MFKESHSQNIYKWGQGRSGHLARSQDLTKPTSDDGVPLFSDRKSCTQQLPWESALSPGTQGLKEEQWEELEGGLSLAPSYFWRSGYLSGLLWHYLLLFPQNIQYPVSASLAVSRRAAPVILTLLFPSLIYLRTCNMYDLCKEHLNFDKAYFL